MVRGCLTVGTKCDGGSGPKNRTMLQLPGPLAPTDAASGLGGTRREPL